MKRLNERKRGLHEIIDAIKTSGPLTQTDLQHNIHLHASTASYLVNDLRSLEIVADCDIQIPKIGPGKPAKLLKLNNDLAHFLGIYVKDDAIDLQVMGLDGNTLQCYSLPISSTRELEAVTTQAIEKAVLDDAKIRGIGIAIKGIIYNDRTIKFGYRKSIEADNWKLEGFLTRLQKKFEGIPIILENDSSCLAILYQYQKRRQDMNILLYLLNVSPFGIGCAIIQEGKLYRGTRGIAGQFYQKSSVFKHSSIEVDGYSNNPEAFIVNLMSHIAMSGYLLDPEKIVLTGSLFDNVNEESRDPLIRMIHEYQLPFEVLIEQESKEYNPAAGVALISTAGFLENIINEVGVR